MAFLAGILAADYLGGGMFLWCAVALGEAIVWAALLAFRARANVLLVPLLVLVAAAGAARSRSTVEPAPDDVGRLVADGPRVVMVEGTVVGSPRRLPPPPDVFLPYAPYYERMTLVIDCRQAEVDGRRVPARGQVRVTAQGVCDEDQPGFPRLGDGVEVVGFLAPFREPTNPGAFDFGRYMRRQGIRALVTTKQAEAIRVVQPAADRVRWVLGAIRDSAVKRLDRLPSAEGRAVVSAIMLGRRDLLAGGTPDDGVLAGGARDVRTLPGLSAALAVLVGGAPACGVLAGGAVGGGALDQGDLEGVVEQDFIASGAAHFLAVSGLHVGMVGWVVLLLLRAAGAGRRLTALLVAVVVLQYALMTELQPSVVRAAVFIWILCLGWAVGRRRLFFNALAAATLIVLALRPGDLFTASFQLSFGIMLGLMFLCRRIEVVVLRRDKEAEALSDPAAGPAWLWRRALRPTTSLSISAAAIGVPLVALLFHMVAWLSPVTTIILTPLVTLLLANGLILVAFGWTPLWVADTLAFVPDALARLIGAVVHFIAHVPGGHFYVADFGWAWVLIVYGLLWAWGRRERLGISRQRLATAALAAAAVFLWTTGRRAPDHVRATFLAVGGGNANLIELPNGRNFLYDAGSSLSYTRAGEGTTAPALWSRRIGRIDAVFISHPHFDHYKDILPLVDRFGIRRVFVPPTFVRKRMEADDDVLERLADRGVRVEFLGAGDRLAGTGETTVRALWPRGPASQTRKTNDGSLVLEIEERGRLRRMLRRLLLTGDIEATAIDALLVSEPHLKADAMLWPHHGSDPDAVGRLAQSAGAKALVVSCGLVRAQEGDPPWVAEQGIRCRWTGRDGAVTLALEANGPAVETFAGGR